MRKNENKKMYKTSIWDSMSIILFVCSIATILLSLVLGVLSYNECFEDDLKNRLLSYCSISASFVSAFFIAWIMRVYDLLKKAQQENKALILIRPHLNKIFTHIGSFLPYLRDFAIIRSDDTIQYPEGEIYYYDDKTKFRSFVDMDDEFSEVQLKLEKEIEKCYTEPVVFQCNEKVIELLTNIKNNELPLKLRWISEARKTNGAAAHGFGSLYISYIEYIQLYNNLAILLERKPADKLIMMNEEEKNTYLEHIKKERLSINLQHDGRIYHCGDRIQ